MLVAAGESKLAKALGKLWPFVGWLAADPTPLARDNIAYTIYIYMNSI